MKNRLKKFFDQEATAPKFDESEQVGDLAKIVAILNKSLSPHVRAKMVGEEAVIQCKNKTVWINSHCLVTGESATPL